jgi:dihydrofolate reductase
VIGHDNKLLWHYHEDLQYFKKITLNKIIIMGRKTFDSIILFAGKPLPHRKHIVISHSNHPSSENVFYVTSLADAYKKSNDLVSELKLSEDVFIIGGSEIYRQTLNDCYQLYITLIQKNYSGDSLYPDHYSDHFKLNQSMTSLVHPEISFQTWVRK